MQKTTGLDKDWTFISKWNSRLVSEWSTPPNLIPINNPKFWDRHMIPRTDQCLSEIDTRSLLNRPRWSWNQHMIPAKSEKLWYHLLCPEEPITCQSNQDQHFQMLCQSQKIYSTNQILKREEHKFQWDSATCLPPWSRKEKILSDNLIIRITNWFKDPTRETTHSVVEISQTN